MSTWTNTALRSLEGYLERNRLRLVATGADAEEVVSDLRRHVEEEVAALRLPVVTEEDVRRIVTRMGPLPPEEEPPLESDKQLGGGPPSSNADTLAFGLLMVFGVALPAFTLIFEMVARLCAGTFFDPLPTPLHTALVALVPVVNLAAWCFLAAPRSSTPRWLWLGNGIVFGVCLYYAALFLPMTPFAFPGIAYFGLGLLPLAPLSGLISAWYFRGKLRERWSMGGKPIHRGWGISALMAALVLLLTALPGPLTRHWIDQAGSEDVDISERAINKLRAWGNEEAMLMDCYGRRNRLWIELFGGSWPNAELARQVYYRVTGRAFNSVPPPMSKHQPAARALLDEFDWDAGLGGETVAGQVKGLSLMHSRLDGICRANEGWAYVEWILEFKNEHPRRQREARAQVQLPPGAVVSRLTLWVHGEEREAAFAGRSHARAAYQKVAVVQRQDPVLVTTSGPDRILVQCFPIEPNGGLMKIRIGMTVPLLLESPEQAALRLPVFLERNFALSKTLRHHVWLETSDQPLNSSPQLTVDKSQSGRFGLRGEFADWMLGGPDATVRLVRSSGLDAIRARDSRSESGSVIRQTLESGAARMPVRIALVLDGSKEMTSFYPQLAEALHGLPAEPELAIWLAQDGVKQIYRSSWISGTPASEPIARLKGMGGQESLAALLQAWEWAAAKSESVVLWIHAGQPVLLGNIEALKQRIEWRGETGPALIEFAVLPGPNRIAEQLASLDALQSLPRLGHVKEDLDRLFGLWSGRQTEYRFTRVVEEAGVNTAESGASSHVVRLWAKDQVRELIKSRRISEAVEIAARYQLVTAVSGAVVLETEQQFKDAGLTPVDPATVPVVPEPGTWALLALGLLSFVLWRRYRGGIGGFKGKEKV
jgi:hypothetical protein